MNLLIVLIVILLLFSGLGLPTWGIHNYGYAPSGIVFVIVIVLVVLLLAGRL